MTHLALIEIVLIGKCIYSQLARAVQNRQKIIHVEVRNSSEKMLRHISKRNLNIVIETFQKKKNYALFDKFWYLKRSERFVELVYEGLNVDDRTGSGTVHFGSLDARNQLIYHRKAGRGMPRAVSTTMRGEHNKSVSPEARQSLLTAGESNNSN